MPSLTHTHMTCYQIKINKTEKITYVNHTQRYEHQPLSSVVTQTDTNTQIHTHKDKQTDWRTHLHFTDNKQFPPTKC